MTRVWHSTSSSKIEHRFGVMYVQNTGSHIHISAWRLRDLAKAGKDGWAPSYFWDPPLYFVAPPIVPPSFLMFFAGFFDEISL